VQGGVTECPRVAQGTVGTLQNDAARVKWTARLRVETVYATAIPAWRDTMHGRRD
jgi:hypothetical protein